MAGGALGSQACGCTAAAGPPRGTSRWAHPAGPLCWGPAWLREGRRHHLLGTRGPAAVAVVGRGPNAPSRPRCPACPRPVPGGRRVRRRAARPPPGHLRVQQCHIGPRDFAHIPRHVHRFEVKVDDVELQGVSWAKRTEGAGGEAAVTPGGPSKRGRGPRAAAWKAQARPRPPRTSQRRRAS